MGLFAEHSGKRKSRGSRRMEMHKDLLSGLRGPRFY